MGTNVVWFTKVLCGFIWEFCWWATGSTWMMPKMPIKKALAIDPKAATSFGSHGEWFFVRHIFGTLNVLFVIGSSSSIPPNRIYHTTASFGSSMASDFLWRQSRHQHTVVPPVHQAEIPKLYHASERNEQTHTYQEQKSNNSTIITRRMNISRRE